MNPITRQHAETRLDELSGEECRRIVAIREVASDGITQLFVHAGGNWYRTFIDEGVLFWSEGDEPTAESELAPGEAFANLIDTCSVRLESIQMTNGALSFRFVDGRRLTVTEDEHGLMRATWS